MTNKVIAAATQADASVCNQLQPPSQGCNAGTGIQIVIPANWATLIAQGIEVPGCTYSHIEQDGSLIVTDMVQAAILIPADTQAIPAAQVQALQAALATAQTAQVATADVQPSGVVA